MNVGNQWEISFEKEKIPKIQIDMLIKSSETKIAFTDMTDWNDRPEDTMCIFMCIK